jgi:hypothetical protein
VAFQRYQEGVVSEEQDTKIGSVIPTIAAVSNRESAARTVTIHVLIVAGFLVALLGLTMFLFKSARRVTSKWPAETDSIRCTNRPQEALPELAKIEASAEEKDRLKGQFQGVQSLMKTHLHLMVLFYQGYFVTTILIGVLASIAAVTLLLITSAGWEHSSSYARTIFLVATVSATYCAAFPSILSQQKNLEDSRNLYTQDVSLINEMCSYTATGEGSGTKPGKKTAAEFIGYVDSRVQGLTSFPMGLDSSRTPDFYQALRRGVEPPASTKPQESKGQIHKTRPKPQSPGSQGAN